MNLSDVESTTVVVIGAGQAGLSAAYHLHRRAISAVILDAETAPGGAWQHRWESLTMATVNGIFDLPTFSRPTTDDAEPSRVAVPRYFAAFEREYALAIRRPCRVTEVTRADADPRGPLRVQADCGVWETRAIINATGTWTNPVLPRYPGADSFAGRQLHTRDYVAASEFAGQRVAVVGGGISAIQLLEELSRGAGAPADVH